MDDIIIGVYKNCSGPTGIYLNSETEEVFYHDDQDSPYIIFGCDMENPPVTDVNIDINVELDELPENVTGVIYDGDSKWILTSDYKAYRVPADATDISCYTRVVDYSDDTEYEPLEDEG